MRTLMLAAAIAFSAGPAAAAIKEIPVTYKDGATTLKGYVVYDDAKKGRRPGVVVVPEWWGITPHVRGEAKRLAGEGYTALVADMYGDGKSADNPTDAGALSGGVMKDPAAMQSRFNAAMATLQKHSTVDRTRIAAIGFCFGGGVVLNMARAGADLKGVAAFHPSLAANVPMATPGKVKGKVLVLAGSDDPFIKPEEAGAFKQEMTRANVDFRYIDYPGAVHAFTNPDATAAGKKWKLPLKYDAKADKASKAEADKLLASVLAKK